MGFGSFLSNVILKELIQDTSEPILIKSVRKTIFIFLGLGRFSDFSMTI